MPPYDPKGNRPKLTRISDEQTPVDAILGPPPEAPAPPEEMSEDASPRLAVVPPTKTSTPSGNVTDSDEPGLADRRKGVPKGVVIVAAVAAAVLVAVAVRSRRG